MPARDTSAPGTPIWLDLASTDVEEAVAFYSALLGWGVERSGPEFNEYVTFTLHGRPIAGLGAADDGQDAAWLVYLATDDADATAASVTASGGTVLFSHEIGDLGTTVRAIDPTGAPVGVWQPGSHRGFAYFAEPGAPAWFELHASDYSAAVPFYESAFGWSTDVLGDSDEFRMVTTGRPPVAGIFDAKTYLAGRSAQWLPHFLVRDTDDAAAALVELGGTQFDPATDTPFGRMTHVADPRGARFCIVQEL